MDSMDSTAESRLLDAIVRIDELTRGRPRRGIGHDDADDIHGTIESDDAIGFDPLPLLQALDEHGARVVIIGQVAGILHGSTELTGDLDLLWSGDGTEAAAMVAGFATAGASLFDDDNRPLVTGIEAFELPKVTFSADSAAGDCCTPSLPWGDLDVGAYIDRAEAADVAGVRVHYLNVVDLIAMRRAVGREKDLRRAAELERLAR